MFNFSEKDLLDYATLEDVRKHIDSYDMFAYYIGNFTLGRPMLSPLEPEKSPSFSIYARGGEVLFNDFRIGGGDIIKFVQLKFGLDFRGAINKLMYDAGLSDKFKTELTYVVKPLIKHDKVISYTKPIIKIKTRNWTNKDADFWKSFHILGRSIKKYRVFPISHIFINDKIIKAEPLAFAFKEFKDDKESLTIYQPYSKTMKWFKSHDASVFYGWTQLPETGDRLIITKSMKDVMVIDSITSLPTVALQNEKIKPKKQVIEELAGRFKEIYLLYDNDYGNEEVGKVNYGREFGSAIASEFNLIQAEIPDNLAKRFEAKDISDLAKNAGVGYCKGILNSIYSFKV